MEEKKIKKKKLTLSVSSKKPYNAPHYSQKKLQEDGEKRNFNRVIITLANLNQLVISYQKKHE